MSNRNTTPIERRASHLGDLARELPDWLRARTGWPEGAVAGACRLTAAVTGAASGRIEADVELDHEAVLVHVSCCRESELVSDAHGTDVRVSAHSGDVLVRLAGQA
jgi:hypothetical protein